MLMHTRHLLGHSNSCNGQTDSSSDNSAPGRGWRVSQPQRTPLCHGFLEGSRLIVQQALCRWEPLEALASMLTLAGIWSTLTAGDTVDNTASNLACAVNSPGRLTTLLP